MPRGSLSGPSRLPLPTARAVLAASPDAFVAVDQDGAISAWNPAAEATFGWARSAVLGLPVEEVLLPARHRARYRSGFERHRRTGESRTVGRLVEMRMLHRDGHELPVEMTVGATGGEDPVLFAFLRDVRERRARDEEAGWNAEVVRSSRDAIVTVDLDGVIRSANPAFETTYGYPAEIVVGARMDSATDGARAASGRTVLEHVRAGVPVDDLVLPYDHPDGRERDLAISLTPIFDRKDRLRGGTLHIRDVTERHREAKRLHDQLERLQSLSRRTPDTVVDRAPGASAIDEAAPVTHLLQAAREHLGLEVAWLSSIDGDRLRFDAISGDASVLGGADAGDAMPLQETYCSLMLDGRVDHIVPDTRRNALTAELPATAGGVSAYAGVPVVLADGSVYGTFCVAGTTGAPALRDGDERFLQVLARLAAATIDLGRADQDGRRAREELDAVHALLAALDARDHYTGEHSRAVVDLAVAVADRLGLAPALVEQVEQVALLHDVGKVGIPDVVLQKPGPLDDGEWALMREHPAIGERIIAGIATLSHLAPAVRAEHERWDGGGYPDGLAGEAIPISSRIALACDAWHAMRSDRPYRRALRHDEALAELRRSSGGQLDPAVADALHAIVSPRPLRDQHAS